MIIKDKPLHIPACQAMACRFYYPAGVFLNEVAIPESTFCTQGLVRRWSGFVQLEAYQLRLSRYLVMRRADAVFDRDIDFFKASPDWQSCDWPEYDDGLIHAGGVL